MILSRRSCRPGPPSGASPGVRSCPPSWRITGRTPAGVIPTGRNRHGHEHGQLPTHAPWNAPAHSVGSTDAALGQGEASCGMAAIQQERGERANVRVAVGEGTFLVQQGLSQVIAALPGIEQVAQCATAAQLERAVSAQEIDVVVTDVSTRPDQPDGGVALAVRLRETHPGIGVVLLGQLMTPEHATRVFRDGSAGRAYLLRERINSPDELERAIRTVAKGGSVTDPKLVEVLVAERTRAETSLLGQLTPREVEVLVLAAQGRSNASIAEVLHLTKRAVEKHINSIFAQARPAGRRRYRSPGQRRTAVSRRAARGDPASRSVQHHPDGTTLAPHARSQPRLKTPTRRRRPGAGPRGG